jgi:hypothetical protein
MYISILKKEWRKVILDEDPERLLVKGRVGDAAIQEVQNFQDFGCCPFP